MSLIDSHCHLDRLALEKIGTDLDGVVAIAKENGVEQMLCVSINLEHFPEVLRISHTYENIFSSVGVHPSDDGEEPTLEKLIQLADDPKIIAIGETGLDYFYNKGDLEWQRERFRVHIRAAIATGKPLIIHTREAEADTLAIMREEGADQIGGVMHCFTGSIEMAQQCLDLGFYISFSGIVTFRNADDLREIAKMVPEERMLVETDAPYLTPVPKRGKPNHPALVKHVAEHIAEQRGVSFEQIAKTTTANFQRLFGTPAIS
jgi:TatD DNase family protein